MPNGVDWKLPSGEKYHNPVIDIAPILKKFAKFNRFRVFITDYHEGLYCEVFKKEKSKISNYYIIKKIYLTLCENEHLKLELGIDIKIEYGIVKNILIILLKSKRKNYYKNLHWRKIIGYINLPVDIKHLNFLLEESKKNLDNFNELEIKDYIQNKNNNFFSNKCGLT